MNAFFTSFPLILLSFILSSLLLSFPLVLLFFYPFLSPSAIVFHSCLSFFSRFFYHHVFFLSFHFLPASFPFYLIYFFHLFRNKSIFPLTCCGLGYALLRVKGLRGNERTDEGRSESGLQSGGMEKRQIDAGKRRGERKLDGKRE